MMPAERSPAAAYLADLEASLPSSLASRDLLDEVRDHLAEAIAALEADGCSREAAEREAVDELGTVAALAPEFRTAALVCEARRQANRQLLGAMLLAITGAGVFHLLPGLMATMHAQPSALRPILAVTVVAVGVLFVPSLALLGLSRAPWTWTDGRWLVWLVRVQTAATWLFQVGLPTTSAMVAHPVALLAGSPHLWLVVGALAGHVVAGVMVPTPGTRLLHSLLARRP
jgi:uncharacterized membrane protein